MKSILKQIFIVILLCIVILLILLIIFYNYMPISIAVPSNVESYNTSSDVKEEISEDVVQYPKQNVSFEINNSDLTLYKKTKSYNEAKPNPFAEIDSGGTSSNIQNNVENSEKKDQSNVFDTTGK